MGNDHSTYVSLPTPWYISFLLETTEHICDDVTAEGKYQLMNTIPADSTSKEVKELFLKADAIIKEHELLIGRDEVRRTEPEVKLQGRGITQTRAYRVESVEKLLEDLCTKLGFRVPV